MDNLSTTCPPEFITVNGTEYPIEIDFRVWLQVIEELDEFIVPVEREEDKLHNYQTVEQIETLVFDGLINEPWQFVLSAIVQFLGGYPKPDNGHSQSGSQDGTTLYSFKYDINYIILAIRNQSGIDLSYKRTEPFHWWLFLLEFQSLTADHYIVEIMKLRAYNGKDKDMLRAKNAVALPHELSAHDRRLAEEMDNLFYNC
jgi:hypothetical protein